MKQTRVNTLILLSTNAVDTDLVAPMFSVEEESDSGVATTVESKIKRPPLYKVLLHNDDYTTMEFVVHVLQSVFGMKNEESQMIMFKVHSEGFGVCGVYTFEIAETKVATVMQMAREQGHPLKCTYEEE